MNKDQQCRMSKKDGKLLNVFVCYYPPAARKFERAGTLSGISVPHLRSTARRVRLNTAQSGSAPLLTKQV